MPTLTIFTAPKPFTDLHIATIQRNAIQSWTCLDPEVEVLLVGEEAGLADAAAEHGLQQLREVARNVDVTLVSSIFDLARQTSASPLLAYVNADIMLLPDVVQAAQAVAAQAGRFDDRAALGLRDAQPMDFSPGWDERLRAEVKSRGRLHLPAGSDYFVFPRLLFAEMPDFAIGAPDGITG